MIEFLYYWSQKTCSFKSMQKEIIISNNAFVAWRGYYRDICVEMVAILDYMIGGVGREVQIDESSFTRRKYNRAKLTLINGFLGVLTQIMMTVLWS